MKLLIILAGVVLFTMALSRIAKIVRVPDVVALIVGGLILGMPFFQDYAGAQNLKIVSDFGDVALIVLMFMVGLETSYKELLHEKSEAVIVSVFGAAVPFLTGLILLTVLFDFPLVTVLVVSVAMSITAEATTAALLLDLNKTKTRIGTLMMESGIIDDFLNLIKK